MKKRTPPTKKNEVEELEKLRKMYDDLEKLNPYKTRKRLKKKPGEEFFESKSSNIGVKDNLTLKGVNYV